MFCCSSFGKAQLHIDVGCTQPDSSYAAFGCATVEMPVGIGGYPVMLSHCDWAGILSPCRVRVIASTTTSMMSRTSPTPTMMMIRFRFFISLGWCVLCLLVGFLFKHFLYASKLNVFGLIGFLGGGSKVSFVCQLLRLSAGLGGLGGGHKSRTLV